MTSGMKKPCFDK